MTLLSKLGKVIKLSGTRTASAQRGKVKAGDIAPDFSLPNQWGQVIRLNDLIGKNNIVLYFYPRDNTPGCKQEAAAFRENHKIFRDLGAIVLGISSGSVESHYAFSTSHDIPFYLLSDADGRVRKQYGVKPTLWLIPGRVTYVIDKEGVVRYIVSSQLHPRRHVDGSLWAVNALRQGDKI
jgi:peroxiredoxin Q/BCP